MYASDLAGTRYRFEDLKALLAAATPLRSATSSPASPQAAPSSALSPATSWPTCR